MKLNLTPAGVVLSDRITEEVANQTAFACRYRQLSEVERTTLTTTLGKLQDLVDRDFLPTRR